MADSIETSEREAEEPRDQSRPQDWDYETATRVFVGGGLLPIREMAAEPAPPPVAAGYEPHPVGTGERIRFLERVNAELVEERDLYKTRCIEAEVFAGTLAVHVLGHFAMPDHNSEAICKQWAENIQRQHSEHVAERASLTSATKEQK